MQCSKELDLNLRNLASRESNLKSLSVHNYDDYLHEILEVLAKVLTFYCICFCFGFTLLLLLIQYLKVYIIPESSRGILLIFDRLF